MKTVFIIILFAACTALTTAQVRKITDREVYRAGDIELGMSTNTGLSDKSTSSNIYWDEGREFYLSLSAYGGIYIIDGLSVGPEIGFNFSMDYTTYIIGNVCYNFNTASRSFYPYIKAGYGVTDIINHSGEESGMFESLNYSLLNFGVGIKFLQSERMAFNVELNYKYISGSDSQPDYYYPDPSTRTFDTRLEVLSFSFGSSIAL